LYGPWFPQAGVDPQPAGGQSGVGKSHLIQAIGRCACVLGYRVRYETSASILQALTAALADHTLPGLLRYYAKFDLVILDEFGFDRVERLESPHGAALVVHSSRHPFFIVRDTHFSVVPDTHFSGSSSRHPFFRK
jgi:IstB-like ATP binding protein